MSSISATRSVIWNEPSITHVALHRTIAPWRPKCSQQSIDRVDPDHSLATARASAINDRKRTVLYEKGEKQCKQINQTLVESYVAIAAIFVYGWIKENTKVLVLTWPQNTVTYEARSTGGARRFLHSAGMRRPPRVTNDTHILAIELASPALNNFRHPVYSWGVYMLASME